MFLRNSSAAVVASLTASHAARSDDTYYSPGSGSSSHPAKLPCHPVAAEEQRNRLTSAGFGPSARIRHVAEKGQFHRHHAHPGLHPTPARHRHPSRSLRGHHAEPARPRPQTDPGPAGCRDGRVLRYLVRDHGAHPGRSRLREDGRLHHQVQRLLPRHAVGPADSHLRPHERRPAEHVPHRWQPARRGAARDPRDGPEGARRTRGRAVSERGH